MEKKDLLEIIKQEKQNNNKTNSNSNKSNTNSINNK